MSDSRSTETIEVDPLPVVTMTDLLTPRSGDPYPLYATLREAAPVIPLEGGNMRLITRYDDVRAILRNHREFSSESSSMGPEGVRSIIATDPPDHTKLRQLVTGPFRPAAIAALEPRIRVIAEGLVDDLIAANRRGDADLVAAIAAPLPVIAIAEMLGVPTDRREEFRRWSDASVAGLSGIEDADGMSPEEASEAMGEFFAEAVRERQRVPANDLISALVTGAEPLSDGELLYFCITLLVAGNETTTNLVGNATLALFDHPEAAARLWADPSLVADAMEEALRYEAPVQMLARTATEDVTIAGEDIPAGTMVMLILGSANRDPAHYEDPDTYDIDRDVRDHVAFGNGIHLCLGAHLARLEARVAFEVMISRIRDLRPDGPSERNPMQMLRGVRHLPVTFEEVTP